MGIEWHASVRVAGPAGTAILALAALAASMTVLAGAGTSAAAARPGDASPSLTAVASTARAEPGAAPNGTISTVAGGVGGPAAGTSVNLGVSTPIAGTASSPCGVAFGRGQLLVADNWTVRSVDPASGRLTTPVGTAASGPFSDGGPAAGTSVDTCAVAVDAVGNLVIADAANDRIRVVAAATGTFYGQQMTAGDVYTIAGTGSYGSSGDGGPAASAPLSDPASVAADGVGNLVITSNSDNRVRVIAGQDGSYYGQPMTAGDIYTIAGDGTAGYTGDGGPATSARLDGPQGVTVDAAGNLVIADSGNSAVRVIAGQDGSYYGQPMTAGDIYTIAGTGTAGYTGDGNRAAGAELNAPQSLTVDGNGNVVVADTGNYRIRVVAAGNGRFYGKQMTTGDIYTVAGGSPGGLIGDGGPAAATRLSLPYGAAVDAAGNTVIADTGNNRIRVIAGQDGTFYGQPMTAGNSYTVAGTGTAGFSGDGHAATAAKIRGAAGVTVGAGGNLVLADTGNNRIRVVAATTGTFYGQQMTTGDIYTVAGTGAAGYAGDRGPAASARLTAPVSVTADASGNLVVADSGNNVIRVIAGQDGTFYGQPMTAGDIYTVAGDGTAGYTGDGGPATSAGLYYPQGVAVDAAGNLVIADTGNSVVREVAGQDGTFYGQQMSGGDIYTIAGTGTQGFSGDGGPATSAGLAVPAGLAVDAAGNLVIADYGDNRVRVVAAGPGSYYGQQMSGGDIYTIAGTGTQGFSGDGGPAASATLHYPQDVTVDGNGNVLVTDSGNNRVRMIAGSNSGARPGRPAAATGRAGPRARAGAQPESGHAARAGDPAAAGPYVTLLFSRTEVGAADNCVPDNSGIAPLDTVVAPYLHSLGMAGTGTLVTGVTQATVTKCTHFGDSLTSSWANAANLANNFGWSFVSHTATYPSQLGKLTATQSYAETCGSAAALDGHGLPGGHGLIAYPGVQNPPLALQARYGANCFAWGRTYDKSGTTLASAGTTPPYWGQTEAVNGGACHVRTAPCYTVASGANGHSRYDEPSTIIAQIQALQPGQWFTLQAYVLVTGSNPAYSHNATRWDCTSPNPALHWTNDNERYCYSDWQQIINAIAALPNVTVTDPLTVGVAFGRPASYP